MTPVPLSQRAFSHDFVDALPADAYSIVDPTPVKAPRLIAWSDELAARFGLPRPPPTGPDADLLGGNLVLPGMKTYAARYGGHQFGHWAGQLGDGRALGLGELRDRDGARWEFQLKGAGRTPYSRGADGRAVLRSSIREFLCSEAMFHLGVPTTRALSVTSTGDEVLRDMFYDGHPALEPGAIVCRVSPSFIRFGNFEIFASRGQTDVSRALMDRVIRDHFPDLGGPSPEVYVHWFHEVARRTAFLIAQWMRVGFVHGVMNTDNMSILGLTIDYGPYGWLDDYDPTWTPNTTDLPGRRYCYGRQAEIGLWNLTRLAGALSPVVPEAGLRAGLDEYERVYAEEFLKMMAHKLGFPHFGSAEDIELIVEMDRLLRLQETDMTIFFRGLNEFRADGFYADPKPDVAAGWNAWLARYRARTQAENLAPAERLALMNSANPLYVPRNYLVQEAIDLATTGDFSRVDELLEVFRNPYVTQPGREAFAAKRPDWARNRAGCSTLSCSS